MDPKRNASYSKYIYRPCGKCYQCTDETTKKKLKPNLAYKEYAAMEELAKRKDLIITNADKGGIVVIMDTDIYIKEANRQLSDKASYKQLTQDPTLQHNRLVNQTMERFKMRNYFLKELQMV